MDKKQKKQTFGKIGDHALIIFVLAVVSLIYVLATINSGQATTAHQHSAPESEMSMSDMAGFMENLPKDIESLVSMGNALMDNGRYVMAIECYSRVLELDPDNPDIMTDRGTCQHALGQNEAALSDFMEVLKIDPQHQVAKFNLGIVYLTMGDTAQTIQWWQTLLDENPKEDLKSRLIPIMEDLKSGK